MSKEPKTAFELAMERLEKQDAEAGIERKPLSDTQKDEIAKIRNKYRAKLAEREILHRSDLAKTPDPADREKLEEQFRRDRGLLGREEEGQVAKIRSRGDGA